MKIGADTFDGVGSIFDIVYGLNEELNAVKGRRGDAYGSSSDAERLHHCNEKRLRALVTKGRYPRIMRVEEIRLPVTPTAEAQLECAEGLQRISSYV